MYCIKCGSELAENAKFCSNCGEQVILMSELFQDASNIELETVDVNKKPSASTRNNDAPDVSQKEISDTTIPQPFSFPKGLIAPQPTSWSDKLKRKLVEFWNQLETFIKITVIGIAICALLCLVSFLCSKIFAGIITICQMVLFITAFLIYKHILKISRQWLYILLSVLAFLLLIPYFILFNFKVPEDIHADASVHPVDFELSKIISEVQFPNFELLRMLPPTNLKIDLIQWESSEEIHVQVKNITKELYDGYALACMEKGFNIVITNDGHSFCADNVESYRLSLTHEGDAMTISLTKHSFPVIIELNCDSNLLFSQYDMDVYLDEVLIGTLEHGKQGTFEEELARGNHTLRLTEQGDDSVNGNETFLVSDTMKISYQIHCYNNKIDMEKEYMESLSPLAEGQAKVPCSADEFKKQIYETALEELGNAGFTNIRGEEIQDLTDSWLSTDGQVEIVSIGGKTRFQKAEIFDKDVEIIITYHTLAPESEEAEESYWEDDGDSTTNNTETIPPIQNSVQNTYDDEGLDEYTAWYAAEDYGKQNYSSFKLHYYLGKLAATEESENTWFLKATCEYETIYGKMNGTCEARVTGTELNPIVTYFIVY